MKKVFKFLSSPLLMTFLLVLLIVVLALATFVENDFGTAYARFKVYNTLWFEVLLLLLSINITVRVIWLKLYRFEKLSVFLFHIAFVVMIIGAGVTRYFGQEGTMHIRESASSSTVTVNERVITTAFFDNDVEVKRQQFRSAIEMKQLFSEQVKYNHSNYRVKLEKYYQGIEKKAVADEEGEPVIGFVVLGNTFRGFNYLSQGNDASYGGFKISFNKTEAIGDDLQLISVGEKILISSPYKISAFDMGADDYGEEVTAWSEIQERKIYRVNDFSFVLQEYYPKALFKAAMPTGENGVQLMQALVFSIENENQKTQLTLFEDEWNGALKNFKLGDQSMAIAYGNRSIELPFSLYLNNFVIERYPGSNSPSSYSSHVSIHEPGKAVQPYHIYMNNILKYRGYRFFQSSYDDDELGTILSVNHDWWGTAITYFSYLLLVLGILWSLLNPRTFFRRTVIGKKALSLMVMLVLVSSTSTFAQQQSSLNNLPPVDKKHAEQFGKMYVQNYKGRTEPLYSYASEILRKLARSERHLGLTPTQILLEMSVNPTLWMDVPIIKVTNGELRSFLGMSGKFASYNDFITSQNGYVLQSAVNKVYTKPAAQRDKFDKAIMKTDEKVNICYAIFSRNLLKILPVPGNADSTKWYSSTEAYKLAQSSSDSALLVNFMPLYFSAIDKAKQDGDYTQAKQYLAEIASFQQKYAGYELPLEAKTMVEIFYQKLNPFKKLFPYFLTLGMLYLILLITFIVIGKKISKPVGCFFYYAVLLGFIVQSVGIASRWYVSGHAPMSNGYESMIFISWVTVLAGFIFNRRSPFALTATAVLAGLTLMVANLSFMDPEITPLVPVLQSYWLTIHVSVITASYGFLGLGALLGIINQVLIVLRNSKNNQRVWDTINNLTVINHKTLIIGLYLLTIGTFLGAVWANESWGRYWGWDPKETWALISILVYTLVTHARMIPGMRGVFTFNVLSLYGFASILMTYFGVNYYLSGLHSYAGGDPVPVPTFVYFTLALFVMLTLLASIRFEKFTDKTQKIKLQKNSNP